MGRPLQLVLVAIAGILILPGCKKQGCTDPTALNYDAKAAIEDGSCLYEQAKGPVDTTYVNSEVQSPQQRVVLVEEFTGVYCYTCPFGHALVDSIIQENPEQIAPLNIHSTYFGIYSNPAVMGNMYDFRTRDGDTIVSMLGGIVSVPSAAVDRVIHSNETSILSFARNNWRAYVQSHLTEIPKVNVTIDTDYDPASRKLQIAVTLDYIDNFVQDHYLSVAIAEDDILDKQLVGTVVVNSYLHPHILHDMITDPKGDLVEAQSEPGRVYVRVYQYTLPIAWNLYKVEVVAFVHEKGTSWRVLQAAYKNIIN